MANVNMNAFRASSSMMGTVLNRRIDELIVERDQALNEIEELVKERDAANERADNAEAATQHRFHEVQLSRQATDHAHQEIERLRRQNTQLLGVLDQQDARFDWQEALLERVVREMEEEREEKEQLKQEIMELESWELLRKLAASDMGKEALERNKAIGAIEMKRERAVRRVGSAMRERTVKREKTAGATRVAKKRSNQEVTIADTDVEGRLRLLRISEGGEEAGEKGKEEEFWSW